jgi:hypothetical protein
MLVALRRSGIAGAAGLVCPRCGCLGMFSLPAAVRRRVPKEGKFRNQMHP